ncbi:MAG: nitroreductase/quinone reductase family protein, partial [Actinomycetes bacterium]
ADVTRTGEWSHECLQVRWLDGAVAAAPGVRFRGRNRAGWARWGRTCEIVAVDEPRELAWQTVSTPLFPDSTVWRIRLEPAEELTRIVQEFEVVRAPKLLDHLYAAIIPAHRDRTARLTADLERIGAIAGRSSEQTVATPVRPADRRLKRRLTRLGNRVGVWLYRRLDGRLAGGGKGVTVLLLTVAGRRTGLPRSTCVRYLPMDDGWVVWGTGSGSRRDPDWFENLRAVDVATVQIGARVIRVRPRELVGAERDRTWRQVVLARAPEVERYARRAGRTIPVATLTPL